MRLEPFRCEAILMIVQQRARLLCVQMNNPTLWLSRPHSLNHSLNHLPCAGFVEVSGTSVHPDNTQERNHKRIKKVAGVRSQIQCSIPLPELPEVERSLTASRGLFLPERPLCYSVEHTPNQYRGHQAQPFTESDRLQKVR